MTNVIKRFVKDGDYGTQTIKMVVKSNERGPQGEQGTPGVAATVTAGKAYAVPATQGPAVMNSGTDSNAVFDFYIPRGETVWGDITGNITNQPDLKQYLDETTSAIQPSDIDYDVMQDLSVNANGSTSVLQLDADKVNLATGATSTKNIPLTVASHETAGVMNSATFDAVSNNSNAIDAILSGMVAISGLPASPSQAELTTAWETATGRTELINRAQILDVDNSKYWTYYTNTETWYPATADIEGTVSTFTNATEGTIKGSTTVGQIYAESNGTGSVNGWDSLSAAVADNTANKLTTTNLTASGGITAITTGSGGNRAINLKITDKAINTGLFTAINLSPSADTTAAWKALFSNTNGVYWTFYSEENMFANQPYKYGLLETIIWSSEVYQRWHSQASGPDIWRSGNTIGWYSNAGNTGAFRTNIYQGLADSVTTAMITNSNVTTDKLANSAVTSAKIGSSAVTTAKIADANVTAAKLANNAVTTAKITDANVTAVKIASGAVTSAKIAAKAVTADKLNWNFLGFAYKTTSRVDFTSSATAYAKTYPSGWTFSFTTVSGGLYDIEAITTYLKDMSGYTEVDFGIELVSGGTEKAHCPSLMTDSEIGMDRRAEMLVQATGTSISVRAYVIIGAIRHNIHLYTGMIKARRVA